MIEISLMRAKGLGLIGALHTPTAGIRHFPYILLPSISLALFSPPFSR